MAGRDRMTSPEWLAADEDDSDRFPQTSQESAQISTHGPDEGSRVVPDPARVARYAEAVRRMPGAGYLNSQQVARAVAAVADEERASLVAEVERLRESGRNWHRSALTNASQAQRAEARAEAAEAECGELRTRVAEVEALRSKLAKVEGCIGYVAQWLIDRAAPSRDPMVKTGLIAASRYVDENLRAVLAEAAPALPTSQTTEGGCSDAPAEQRDGA